jgi:hypothetical protein
MPPFNGFVSEFLIFLAAFYAVLNSATSLTTPGLLIILDLSLIGGLAAACFTKAFAVTFLGTPRTPAASQANEVGPAMKASMVVLALLCFLIAITSPLLMPMLGRILQVNPQFASGIDFAGIFALAVKPLTIICGCVMLLFMLTGLAILLRNRLLKGREIGKAVTWGCGYAHPASTMQYTGSSFAQPLTDIFHSVLRTKSHVIGVEGYFPQKASFKSHTNDLFEAKLFSPFFRFVSTTLHHLVWIQNGVVQLSVLFIALTLLILLIVGLL